MKRALFMHELQRALLLQVTVLLLTIVCLAFLLYAGARAPAFVTLLAGLVLTGLPAGGFPFSQDFQEKQWPLLLTLPIDRSTLWRLIVGAHTAASLLSITAILTIVRLTPSDLTGVSIPLVATYFTLFAAAGFLALLGPGDTKRLSLNVAKGVSFVFAAGGLHLSVIFQMWYVSIMLGLRSGERISDHIPDSAATLIQAADMKFALLGSAFLIVGYLTLTRSFFIRAENRLHSTQLRFALSAIAYMAGVALFLSLTAPAFPALDRWSFREAAASRDGRYLAVVEHASQHPSFGRLSVLDLQTGSLLSTIKLKGIRSVAWSAAGEVLNVLRESRSLFPPYNAWVLYHPRFRQRTVRDHLVTFSRELQEVADLTLDEISDMWPLADGTTLVITREESSGSVISRDVKTRQMKTLVTAPFEGAVTLYAVRDKVFVDFRNLARESNVWMIGEDIEELPWAGPKIDGRPRHLIDGTVYPASKAMIEAVARIAPPPGGEAASGAYLVSSAGTSSSSGRQNFRVSYVDPSTWLFYLQPNSDGRTASLYAFDRSIREWKRFETGLLLQEDERRFVTASEWIFEAADNLGTIRIDSQMGLAAYALAPEGKSSLHLYDARLDKLMVLAEVSRPAAGRVDIVEITGFEGVVISYSDSAFIYSSGSGNAVAITTRAKSTRDVLYLDKEGKQVYLDSASGRIFQKTANAPDRLIWPR